MVRCFPSARLRAPEEPTRSQAKSAARARRRGLLSCRRGAVATEFGLVALPATVAMFAVLECAWQVATLAALDHAALRASRFGITGLNTPAGAAGAPVCRSAAIPWLASASTGGFLRQDRLTVVTRSFASFSISQAPDPSRSTATATAPAPGTPGAGAGGQVVRYDLTYTQPYLLGGIAKIVSGGTAMTHRATLITKNEPFDNAVC